jgi:hypothetical protein
VRNKNSRRGEGIAKEREQMGRRVNAWGGEGTAWQKKEKLRRRANS